MTVNESRKMANERPFSKLSGPPLAFSRSFANTLICKHIKFQLQVMAEDLVSPISCKASELPITHIGAPCDLESVGTRQS